MAWREDTDPIIQKAKRDWAEARRRGDKTAMANAHKMAEQQRLSAGGYSGGADGGRRYAISPHENVDLGNRFRNQVLHDAPVNKLKTTYYDYLTKVQDPRFAGYDSEARRQNMLDIINNRMRRDEETDPYLQIYKGSQREMDKSLEAAKRAKELAIAGGVERLGRGRYEIERLNKDALRQAYVQKMMNEKNLPEQLSRMGITGGETESSVVKQNLDYANNVANINSQRNKDLAALEGKIADLKNSGDTSIADLYAQNIGRNLNNYMSLMQQKANRDREKEKGLEDFGREDFINTYQDAYKNNYMSEINRIKNNNDITDDWKIPYLLGARNKKIEEMRSNNGYTQLSPSVALQLWKAGLINDNDFYMMSGVRFGD